jgi:hypothetical protein
VGNRGVSIDDSLIFRDLGPYADRGEVLGAVTVNDGWSYQWADGRQGAHDRMVKSPYRRMRRLVSKERETTTREDSAKRATTVAALDILIRSRGEDVGSRLGQVDSRRQHPGELLRRETRPFVDVAHAVG